MRPLNVPIEQIYDTTAKLAESTVLGKGTIVPTILSNTQRSIWNAIDDETMCVLQSRQHHRLTRPQDGDVWMLTIGRNMRYRDFAQALYRLRKIEFEAVTDAPWPSAKSVLRTIKPRERPDSVTVDELIKWLHKNDDMYNEEQKRADTVSARYVSSRQQSFGTVLRRCLHGHLRVHNHSRCDLVRSGQILLHAGHRRHRR
jgi:hypothetical protein